MKSMPSPKNSEESISSNSEGAEKSAPEVQLVTPSHEEIEIIKPSLDNGIVNNESEMKVKPLPSKGIDVVADRKGFYNGHRYNEGDSFTIRSEEEFGEWMKCVDSAIEKKRIEFYKLKKAKK